MAELPTAFPTTPAPGDYDRPEPEAERKRNAETSIRRSRAKEVQAALLSTPQGREWLWGILNSLNTFEPRISMTGSDFENGWNGGEREAGLRMLRAFVRSSPAEFAQMFVENDFSE